MDKYTSDWLKNTLLPLIKTKDDINLTSVYLEKKLSSFFLLDDSKKDNIGNVPIELALESYLLTRELNSESLRILVVELKESLSKIKLVQVDVPFTPSKNFIDKLYEMMKKELKSPLALGVNYVPEAKLDVRIYVDGRYINLTAKKLLDSVLASKDVIKEYL